MQNVDTTKYVIYADITAEGIVERPDVVGAIFGQTEGLLGSDLDLRDLQKTGRLGRTKILIIEDNPQNLYLMRFLLEHGGLDVVAATDGREGIEMATEEMPDAYKNVTEVVNTMHNAGITRKVARFTPIGVIKG